MYTVNCPNIPTAIPVCEQLHPGCVIDIHGRVANSGDVNFAVEFLSGPHIVLHVNFRFQCDEREVVMNSCSNGLWGEEVRHYNPLHHDDSFHLHICVHQEYYRIEVNGVHMADYSHRFPMESVQALGVKGNVCIEKVDFTGFNYCSVFDENFDMELIVIFDKDLHLIANGQNKNENFPPHIVKNNGSLVVFVDNTSSKPQTTSEIDKNYELEYGHCGYKAYGTDCYQPPVFNDTHPYQAYF